MYVLGNVDAEGLVDLIFQLLFFHVLHDDGDSFDNAAVSAPSFFATALFECRFVANLALRVVIRLSPDMVVQAFAATRSATVAVHCTFI